MDNKLSWNESDYNGITEIRLPYDKIWKPVSKINHFSRVLIIKKKLKKKDVLLYNNVDTSSLTMISTHMIITSNGNVTWLSTSIFHSSCMINVRYFPFDVQNCSLLFGECLAVPYERILFFSYE